MCVCGLDHCKCTGRTINKNAYLSPNIVPTMKDDKSKDYYPNYSRSLLFELYCYDDKRTKNIVPGLNPLYSKVEFNKIWG